MLVFSVLAYYVIHSLGVVLIYADGRYGAFRTFRGIGVALVPFVVSFLCDFVYIVLTRWILRRISAIDRIYEIVLMIVVNLALVAVPVVGTIYIGSFIFKFAPYAGAFVVVSILFNSIDLFAGLAALLLALFLMLHRLFWPIVHRPLYTVHRFALPTENKKLLFSIGVALLLLPRPVTLKAVAKYCFKESLEMRRSQRRDGTGRGLRGSEGETKWLIQMMSLTI